MRRSLIFLLTALTLLVPSGSPVAGQSSKAVLAFRATHYDVDATLHPADQSLSARAKIEFTATTGTRDLVVELHEDLQVSSVKNEKGQSIPVERDAINPLYLHVSLPEAVTTGKQVDLDVRLQRPDRKRGRQPHQGPALRFGR